MVTLTVIIKVTVTNDSGVTYIITNLRRGKRLLYIAILTLNYAKGFLVYSFMSV